MRVYIPTTASTISQLLLGSASFDEYLAPEQFDFVDFDVEVDQEEQEHLVSQLAAMDSLELNQGKLALVIAADLQDEQLNGEAIELKFSQVAALLYSEDGEELSWYAPEEITFKLNELQP